MIQLSLWTTGAFLCALYVLRRALYVVKSLKAYKGVPKYLCLLSPTHVLGNVLPQSRLNPGVYHAWSHRYTRFASGAQAIVFVPLLFGPAVLHCASAEAFKQITSDVNVFVKPQQVTVLDLLGPNVNTLNREEWRRHRKVTAPAFDNQIYQDVWRVTSDLYRQMMGSEAWKSGDVHYFPNFNVFTTRLALLVIAACGFNMNIGWEEELRREDLDLTVSVDSTIVTVSTSLMPRIYLPKFLYRLPIKGLQKIDVAFKELDKFLLSEVVAKRTELAALKQMAPADKQNKNLFARIVLASLNEKGFNEREIIGNLFIYLFAGHETTAHTLVVTLALLALHHEEQERVYNHLLDVVGYNEIVYEDCNDILPVLHCFYEALRLYPAATNMMRETTTDITMYPAHYTPANDPVFASKGTIFLMDMIGACRDPHEYTNPDEFQPRRWESCEDATLDNFFAFSGGPRQCLGKKFSTVEAVCFLSHVLREWRFEVKLEEGETRREWQERVMKPTMGVTLKIDNIPLLVVKRQSTVA